MEIKRTAIIMMSLGPRHNGEQSKRIQRSLQQDSIERKLKHKQNPPMVTEDRIVVVVGKEPIEVPNAINFLFLDVGGGYGVGSFLQKFTKLCIYDL